MKRFILLFLVLLVASCGPTPTELNATVESEVAAAVVATLDSLPTATPAATDTPAATLTARPTLTPEPTQTPASTYTPEPTLTPNPTHTPLPTDTPTPTTISTATAVASLPPASQGTTAGGFTSTAVANTINQIQALMNILAPTLLSQPFGGNPVLDYTVDCPAFIQTYNSFNAGIVPRPATGDPTVQAAYTNYESAVNLFRSIIAGWVETCQAAIVSGEIKSISNQEYQVIYGQRVPVQDTLEQVKNTLLGLES
jgi:hypothetical protein